MNAVQDFFIRIKKAVCQVNCICGDTEGMFLL